MKKKRIHKGLKGTILLILMCVFAVAAVGISAPAMAVTLPIILSDPDFVAAYTPVAPTLDGNLSTSDTEWQLYRPASKPFLTDGGVGKAIGFSFDETNLYVAVLVDPDGSISTPTSNDKVWLYFDNDNDGGVPCPGYPTMTCPEVGDDIFGFDGSPYVPYSEGFSDGYSSGTFSWRKDLDIVGGSSDGAAAWAKCDVYYTGEENCYEFEHPLNSSDDDHDFSLEPGDTVGFGLRLTVDGVDKGWWPASDPSSWAKVIIPIGFDDFTYDVVNDLHGPESGNAMGDINFTIPELSADSILVRVNNIHGFHSTNQYLEISNGCADDTVSFSLSPYNHSTATYNSGIYHHIMDIGRISACCSG